MNTDYDAFTPDRVERYFQHSLFYGMFPGMFSHNAAENPYWQNPKWYNRDRPLFKKYLPLIKRVAEAGWQPVTLATCDNPQVLVERFGTVADGAVCFTLFNESAAPQRGNFQVDRTALGLRTSLGATELISESPLPGQDDRWQLDFQPQEAKVVRVTGR